MSDNLISSYPNSPAGIYPAVFCKSKIVKYPIGKRQVLEFLILKDNEKDMVFYKSEFNQLNLK